MSLINILVAIVLHPVKNYLFDQYAFGLITWTDNDILSAGELTSNTLEIMGSMSFIFTFEIVFMALKCV